MHISHYPVQGMLVTNELRLAARPLAISTVTFFPRGIRKLVWWVYVKPDSLWVKWVNHVYLQGDNWASYKPKSDATWSWKAIRRVKELFADAYQGGQWSQSASYSVTSGYNWIRKPQPQVSWAKYIWNSWCIPKHSFINWLIARETLLLKDRLFGLGIATDDLCVLSGLSAETHSHLFQQCVYTQLLMSKLMKLLNIRLPGTDLLNWVQKKPWNKTKKLVVNASVQACWYVVWHQRNCARLELRLRHPDDVLKDVFGVLKIRSEFWCTCIKKRRDWYWVKSLLD
ncbi:hypothetical protein RND81_14G197500 [Saponaria officinalis]|uniref:Reverse transcriptase zinc-binding domain-containing protein n=1 Tax=Saponaria officinalis TaxID=3572 RepID=A0AAW1GSK3_SAPOF